MGNVEKIFQNCEFFGFVIGVGKASVLIAGDGASQDILFPANRNNILISSSSAEIALCMDF
jgi:hypothetical protein